MTAIHLENVSKTFYAPAKGVKGLLGMTDATQGLQALQSIDLSIEHGEFFGLLGPNGAGKTTIISILAGLTRASTGRASVCGYDVINDFRLSRRALGVVPQEIVYDPFFTVREKIGRASCSERGEAGSAVVRR